MKKLKIIALTLISAICLSGLCGCSLIGNLTDRSNGGTPVSTYVPKTDVNAESLMTVRDTIRQFNISIDTNYYTESFGGMFTRSAGEGLGSGIIFANDSNYYYALTNNHVITDTVNGRKYRVSYTVTDIHATQYSGTVIMKSAADDIAIIRFPRSANASYTLPSANYTARLETNLTPGEFVLAVGNPSGVNNIVTYGLVNQWVKISNVSYNVINHTALINPGNSGGALCDIEGNLLGMNTWGTEDRDDMNYSIPLTKLNEYIASFYKTFMTPAEAA